jgi:hypothetical protein
MQMVRTRRARSVVAVAALLSAATSGVAQIVQWNFQGDTFAPSILNTNLQGFTIGQAPGSGLTSTFASGNGSSDPETVNDRAWNTTGYPAQGTRNREAGVQFTFNTTNFDINSFSFDWRTSNSAARHMQTQYTLDGTTWINYDVRTSGGGDFWNNTQTLDFSSIPAADNNPNFGIRLVSMFSPTPFTDSAGNWPADVRYQRADAVTTSQYATTGTWRFDMITLDGVFNPPPFVPRPITWNTASGNWDTNTSNLVWRDASNNPTFFAQSTPPGNGDNVTFNNPAANSVITVQAAGVTPDSTTITNNATLTFTGGAIGGTGGLRKFGNGRLILAASNAFSSGSNATEINAGIVETRANGSLGIGTVSIGNATWESTTATQTHAGLVNLAGDTTFNTIADLTLQNGLTGPGVFLKTGAGTLGIGGVGTNTGTINITGGTVRMDNVGALGGNGAGGPKPELNVSNATVVVNAPGNNAVNRTRLSSDINLNNANIVRNQITPGLGADPTNSDTEFSAYTTGETSSYFGGVMRISGNTTFRNLETRTASASGLPGGPGVDNALVIRMPMIVNPGATLSLEAVNDQLSQPGGVPTGSLGNTAVALRAPSIGANDNDSLTISAGGTVQAIGVGEKRFGASNRGKQIVALGTSAAEAVLKLDRRSYLTDLGENGNTLFTIGGSGNGGLRIEAPMNADYSAGTLATAGLFGINTHPDTSTVFGNSYTAMSPNRFNALSGFGNEPTQTPDGTPITRGGVLTLAGFNPDSSAPVTGLVDNGPNVNAPIKLALDNTSKPGNITYELDAQANGNRFANFAGLILKRSGTSEVTTKLLSNASLPQAGATYEHKGGTLDVNGRSLTVATTATLETGVLANTGAVSPATGLFAPTVQKVTGATFVVGPNGSFDTNVLSVQAGTLQFGVGGVEATASVTASLAISAGAAIDLTDNNFILNYTGASPLTTVRNLVISGRNFGAWDGPGINSSSAATNPNQITAIGLLEGSDYIAMTGLNTFSGRSIDATSLLLKYTYNGDTDFNGTIDFDDYARIDSAFLGSGLGSWMDGDSDYSGTIDFDDYALIDAAFLLQGGILDGGTAGRYGTQTAGGITPGMSAMDIYNLHASMFGEAYSNAFWSLVPEPSALSILALAGVASLRRRRA